MFGAADRREADTSERKALRTGSPTRRDPDCQRAPQGTRHANLRPPRNTRQADQHRPARTAGSPASPGFHASERAASVGRTDQPAVPFSLTRKRVQLRLRPHASRAMSVHAWPLSVVFEGAGTATRVEPKSAREQLGPEPARVCTARTSASRGTARCPEPLGTLDIAFEGARQFRTTARSAAIESRFPARSASVAMVVCVVALLAAAVVPSARADVVRLSRQEALAALARPVPTAVSGVAAPARAGAPTVTTGTASAVTAASATVGGTVNPNGRRTTYHFDYGTTTAYGSLAPSPDARRRLRPHRARSLGVAHRAPARDHLPLPPRRHELARHRRGRRRDLHHRTRPSAGGHVHQPRLRVLPRPDGPEDERGLLRVCDGGELPDPAFDRPRQLEYRRHRVHRGDVPRLEQRQPMGAERARRELAGWALRQPPAARGLPVLPPLLHGVEQRAADRLELHRRGRLGPARRRVRRSGDPRQRHDDRARAGGMRGRRWLQQHRSCPVHRHRRAGVPATSRPATTRRARPPRSRSSSSPRTWSTLSGPGPSSSPGPRPGSSAGP